MSRKNQQLFITQTFISLSFLFIFLSSCVSTKKVGYFRQLANDTLLASTVLPQASIQRNDLLNIAITSKNPDATFIFNRPNESNFPSGGYSTNGYLVNSGGFIQFPFFGTIKVQGLTRDQLQDRITKELVERGLLIDPIVVVRFLNLRVTILGEVNKPAVIPIPNERISLMEALGLAGDITIYGRKDNVLLIREEGSVKISRRINLNSSDFLTSDFYYLKSNDLVYVEANKSKVASTGRAALIAPVIASALSFLVILVDRLVK